MLTLKYCNTTRIIDNPPAKYFNFLSFNIYTKYNTDNKLKRHNINNMKKTPQLLHNEE